MGGENPTTDETILQVLSDFHHSRKMDSENITNNIPSVRSCFVKCWWRASENMECFLTSNLEVVTRRKPSETIRKVCIAGVGWSLFNYYDDELMHDPINYLMS